MFEINRLQDDKQIENPRVVGSNPTSGTIIQRPRQRCGGFFFIALPIKCTAQTGETQCKLLNSCPSREATIA